MSANRIDFPPQPLPAAPPTEPETLQSLTDRWSVHIPRRLLILPPSALVLGALIGVSRGGSRARLRFLAENAHRQPTTIQGWYFYTKTRNYRILFGSLREGAKTGVTLGAATALYVLSEEGVRSLRNRMGFTREVSVDAGTTGDVVGGKVKTTGGAGFEWIDGGIAGSILGAVISGFNRFPTPLFARTVLLGTTFGALEGCLRIAQDTIGRLKEESERQKAEEDAKLALVKAEADAAGQMGAERSGEGRIKSVRV